MCPKTACIGQWCSKLQQMQSRPPPLTRTFGNDGLKVPDGEELTNSLDKVPRRAIQYIIAEEPYQGQAPTGWLHSPPRAQNLRTVLRRRHDWLIDLVISQYCENHCSHLLGHMTDNAHISHTL